VTHGIADTSLFIASEAGRPVATREVPERLAVSVVTLAELRAGVLAARDLEARDRRLTTYAFVRGLDLVPVDADVAEAWAGLRVRLRDLGLKMGVNDAWIAATAIALGVPLVTQDADFDGVPGLDVVRV
jgi:predicted nucleic acid-binding protein